MSNKVVVSQPMFFPWVGLFEQIRLADTFVHYDDVQLPQGTSFVNRVQIKTKDGPLWMTVPLQKGASKILIKDAKIQYDNKWCQKHLKFLEINFAKAKFKYDMLDLVNLVYSKKFELISELNIFAIELLANYFDINSNFILSSKFKFDSKSSKKLIEIVKHLNGSRYITGLGALKYIDYEMFENNNIKLEYMDYKKIQYHQLYGEFDPFVSILDLVAMMGKEGKTKIVSESIYYKNYLNKN